MYRKVFGHDGSTRTYVDGVLVEGTEPDNVEGSAFIMPDIEQFYGKPIISPIDDSVITSRSQLREHNSRHGVAQSGELHGKRKLLQEQRMSFTRGPQSTDPRAFRWV
jgi:hypothetical protein